jgi:hypothetical protein
MSEEQRYLHLSNQVFHINDKKVWNGIFQTSCKLIKDDDSKDANQSQYISVIENLIYVKTSRPYVMQVFGQVARFQETPK